MIPPPAVGGASAMNFQVLPDHRGLGTAGASLRAKRHGDASHGAAFRRGPRQVVG